MFPHFLAALFTCEGYWPSAGLLEGRDGMLYGTTEAGGTNNAGNVFKLNKDGSGYTILWSFSHDGGHGHRENPVSGLLEGSEGALYGTTGLGGTNGVGTAFKLNKDGSGYTELRTFSGEGGHLPWAGLVQGKDGALYGTTSSGGDLGFGTVFRLFSSTPVISFERIEWSRVAARLSLSGGAAGQTFQIQATTNLTSPLWQTIGTNQFGVDGKFQFLDTSAPNYSARFYRSATP